MSCLVSGKVLLKFQVENFHAMSSNRCSQSLRKFTYGILASAPLEGGKRTTVQEWDREGFRVKPSSISPADGENIPCLREIPSLDPDKRLAMYLDALHSNTTEIKSLPEELKLVGASLRFLYRKANPKLESSHLSAILWGCVKLEDGSWRECLENSKNQPFDVQAAHTFSQWQCVLRDAIHLNRVLQEPVPTPYIRNIFNGQLVHNLQRKLARDFFPRSLIQTRESFSRYQELYTAITAKQDEEEEVTAGMQKLQLQASKKSWRRISDRPSEGDKLPDAKSKVGEEEEEEIEVEISDEEDTLPNPADAKKTRIRRERITDKGDTWNLPEAAEQMSSDDDEDEDDFPPDDDDDDDEDLDSTSDGSDKIREVIGQMEQSAIQEEEGEELESEQEQDPDRITIHKETLTREDVHWNIKLGAVHLAFPRDAVSEPTLITVHRWKPTVLCPPLQEHEALVSNVIEISSSSQETFTFKAEVKMSFAHSSPGLHGYELVLYKLIHNETAAWEEVIGVEDFRTISDFEEEYKSSHEIPNLHFPVVQADITECATYAVVSRLHLSPEFTITPTGGSFIMPEYPSVSVTIPKKAVTAKTRILLRMKVQEVPGEEFVVNDILIGPVLRIVCDEMVEFLKPVTITLPVSLGDTHHDFPNPTTCRVRILFLSSD
ncbi:uncharacterized protein LOC111345271, partial [Stylophora pistillata]|uniref:uncharacterized protein LOC111345271 n=1 Tax=Stylophora pistillata TaxID=50429 RepID=UPI000C03E14E